MEKIKNFLKFIEKNNTNHLIKILDNKSNFDLFIDMFINNISILDDLKIEYILKIIFNQIIVLEIDLKYEKINLIYNKLKENDNNILISRFINIYQDFLNNKLNLVSLCYQIIKSFKFMFDNLNVFINNKLSKNDIDEINNIIDSNIMPYYNSFFEIRYGKYFFKRIIDCKNEQSQIIHTNEMIFRLRKLYLFFGDKLLNLLNVEIITVGKFWEMKYIDRVNYFRIFYYKTNNFFKTYEKFYSGLNNNINEIVNLTTIHQINYIDKINDTTSSIFFNEDNLEINLNDFDNNTEHISGILIDENVLSELSEKFSDDEEYQDTPIFKMEEDDDELILNDDECCIDDLFVKS